jgi:hypothetical protein
MAAQVCVGLYNRDDTVAGAAYAFYKGSDKEWLTDIEHLPNPVITPTVDFVSACVKKGGIAKGYIRYNATSQKIVIPNLITLAAVLDAVPLEDGDPIIAATGATMVYDAVKEWENFGYYEATDFMYTNYVNLTSTMAKMNPGLDVHTDPIFPKLTGTSDLGLVDYIVSKRLFNFFLNDGCIPLNRDHRLMDKMMANNPWPEPVRVYGYDDTFPLAGDLFEAETNCVKRHNLGQIASNGCSNLAFYSRKPPITTPMLQNPDPAVSPKYNSSKTYILFVMGDGDNINFIKGSRRDWMKERVGYCTDPTSTFKKKCFPLVWSISPALVRAAPDWLRWYYNQSYRTKSDYFVLPPSGDLYSYPSLMEPDQQAEFVTNTEQDCHLLNTSGTVAWDFVGSWRKGIKEYYPRYSAVGVVTALFAVNVPYMVPIPEFGLNEFYKVLGDNKNVVLFKPREWRGGKDPGPVHPPRPQEQNATMMAGEINGYPGGTVTNLYITSDGGANLKLIYDMVQQLDEHVEIVNHKQLAEMALQREALL